MNPIKSLLLILNNCTPHIYNIYIYFCVCVCVWGGGGGGEGHSKLSLSNIAKSIFFSSSINLKFLVDPLSLSHVAVGDIDFNSLDTEITFSADLTRMCFNISVLNDNIHEVPENFFIGLDTEDTSVNIDPTRQNGEAVILDDDGKLQ